VKNNVESSITAANCRILLKFGMLIHCGSPKAAESLKIYFRSNLRQRTTPKLEIFKSR